MAMNPPKPDFGSIKQIHAAAKSSASQPSNKGPWRTPSNAFLTLGRPGRRPKQQISDASSLSSGDVSSINPSSIDPSSNTSLSNTSLSNSALSGTDGRISLGQKDPGQEEDPGQAILSNISKIARPVPINMPPERQTLPTEPPKAADFLRNSSEGKSVSRSAEVVGTSSAVGPPQPDPSDLTLAEKASKALDGIARQANAFFGLGSSEPVATGHEGSAVGSPSAAVAAKGSSASRQLGNRSQTSQVEVASAVSGGEEDAVAEGPLPFTSYSSSLTSSSGSSEVVPKKPTAPTRQSLPGQSLLGQSLLGQTSSKAASAGADRKSAPAMIVQPVVKAGSRVRRRLGQRQSAPRPCAETPEQKATRSLLGMAREAALKAAVADMTAALKAETPLIQFEDDLTPVEVLLVRQHLGFNFPIRLGSRSSRLYATTIAGMSGGREMKRPLDLWRAFVSEWQVVDIQVNERSLISKSFLAAN